MTPKVLDILDRYRAKASFFCIGEKAAAHPNIVTDILRRGHGVENHSMHHSKLFALFGLTALRTDIGMAQSLLGNLAGRPPMFFRAPMGIRNPLLDPVVAGLGLTYISWTRRGFDTSKRDPAVVLTGLTRGLAAGDIILLHDRKSAHGEPIVLTVLPLLLETHHRRRTQIGVAANGDAIMDATVRALCAAATRPYAQRPVSLPLRAEQAEIRRCLPHVPAPRPDS